MSAEKEIPISKRSALDDISHTEIEARFGWKFEVAYEARLAGPGQRFIFGSQENHSLECYPAVGIIKLEIPETESEEQYGVENTGFITMHVDSVQMNEEEIIFTRNQTKERARMIIAITKAGEITMLRGRDNDTHDSLIPKIIPPGTFSQSAEASK